MYRNILIPIDGSATSDAALAEALKFARTMGSSVRVICVYEPLSYILAEGPVDLSDAVRRDAQAALDKAAAKSREAGVPATTELLEAGDRRIPAVIVDEAERMHADLIIMGTHGRRGFEHLVLGSVAEGVMRRAKVPVLLLRSR